MRQKILDFLIYSAVLFLPLYSVRFSVFGMPTNPVEAVVVVAVLIWLPRIKKSSTIFSLPKTYWLSFLFIFVGIIISAALNFNYLAEAGIIKSWFMIPFLFFLIILDQIKSEKNLDQILKVFYVSSASVGLISFFYLLNGRLTFDGRLQAFYLSPNYLAMFLAPGIIVGFFSLLEMIFKTKDFKKSFYFLIFSLTIMLADFYFTFSYGAWLAVFLGLAAALGLTGSLNQSQKIKLLVALAFLLLIAAFFQLFHKKLTDVFRLDPRSSLASRVIIWKSAWKIGNDNPIWGIGPGNFQSKYLEYQKYFPPYLEWAVPEPHNLYLAFWLQSGLLGLTGFLLLSGCWITQTARALRNKRGVLVESALLAVMLSILIHGLADTPYWKNDLAFLFWIIVALELCYSRKIRRDISDNST